VYPECPDTFWSFKHVLKFIRKRAALPPLGLRTVAAMLPDTWEKRLADVNSERFHFWGLLSPTATRADGCHIVDLWFPFSQVLRGPRRVIGQLVFADFSIGFHPMLCRAGAV
jgi:hypothetical protein